MLYKRKIIAFDNNHHFSHRFIIFLEIFRKNQIDLEFICDDKSFTKKKEILSVIWKYSSDADTHTVETHIYRLRKKIKEIFNDELFIKSEKKGYTI